MAPAITGSKKAISALESRIRAFILDHGLAHNPRPLVLGVSGGPDSLSLLHTLHRLSPDLGLSLHVAHFNHGLRAEASDADADFVASQSEALGFPFSTAKEYVKSRAKGHSRSLEEQARDARYDFLARVAHEQNASGVAVAHTADDQAETVLMHMIRGTGLRGLRGMFPVVETQSVSGLDLKLFRPLLSVPRQQTEDYCKVLGLEPRIDHTNLIPETLRNRIRLELLPMLRESNPRFSDALLRLADSAALDLSFIESRVAEIWPEAVEEMAGGLSISRSKLSEIDPALRRRVLSQALESVSGGPSDIEGVHVTSLETLLTRDTGSELDLPKGIQAYLGYDHVTLTKTPTPPPTPFPEQERPIAVPGETLLPGWKITATIEEAASCEHTTNPYSALFDMDRLSEPVTVRRRRDGDRFTPLGMSGSKKLKDFLTDAKVPKTHRDSLPIVLSDDKIIWIVGYRLDAGPKVSETTCHVLRLTFEAVYSSDTSRKETNPNLKDLLLTPEARTETLTPPHPKRLRREPTLPD